VLRAALVENLVQLTHGPCDTRALQLSRSVFQLFLTVALLDIGRGGKAGAEQMAGLVAVSVQSGLKPITIESGPSNGLTRVDTKPASRIQAWQSAPV